MRSCLVPDLAARDCRGDFEALVAAGDPFPVFRVALAISRWIDRTKVEWKICLNKLFNQMIKIFY